MATSHEIWIGTHDSLEAIAREVGRFFGTDPVEKRDEFDTWFDVATPEVFAQVGTTEDYDNDRDLNFADFSIAVMFWGEDENLRELQARRLFEHLKQKNVPLLLTWDAQKALDRFTPRDSAQPNL